jgi:hypothetical protein
MNNLYYTINHLVTSEYIEHFVSILSEIPKFFSLKVAEIPKFIRPELAEIPKFSRTLALPHEK